ncbi:retrovirus-related pol polyprotein from transposon TNT 1-94 [Tanacetum coccineum]
MVFVSTSFGPRLSLTNNQLGTSSNPRNQATIQDRRVTVQTVQRRQIQGYAKNVARNTATNQGVNRQGVAVQPRVVKCYNCQEEGHFARQCAKLKRPKNSAWFKEKMLLTEALESGAYLDPEQLSFLADNGHTIIQAQASQEILTLAAFQTDDFDAFDYDCDDVPSAKAVLMANLSSYDLYVLSEVPFHDINIENQMSYQSLQETQCSEQLFIDNDTEIDIISDSNIISYEQYLQETENPVVQNTTSSVPQDELLTAVIKEMSSQVAKCNKIHSLKLQLNATVESHMTLSTTVKCLKKESKQKENEYLDEIIDLQNKKKALDNVVYKMVPALYDGHTIVKTHVALSITDTEETLELAEESRLKMLAKQNDLSLKEKKVNIAPVDYVALNKLSKHFVKHFVPQKYWLPISQPIVAKPPVPSEPVLKKEITCELPPIS